VGDNGSAYDPPITPAPITTDYNVVTALAPSQTEANLGANSVYEADLDEVVADNYALDYTPPPGSPILTTPGRDMTPEIDALKARFPDVAHFFDHDMNGHPIDWSVPFVGHDASLAFTHGAPAKVTGLSQVPADGEIALSWVEPADNGSPILDYVIQRSADGGVTWFTVPHPAITDTSFTDAGLVNGSDYTHRVAAVNANGQGRWSDRETERPVAAANVAAEDDMTADTSALYVPRNGAEVVVWNETEARIDMTTPSSGVASFMGVYHEVDLTGHVGVPLKLTMDLENVSSSVAILVEFGTSADADKWAETPAGLLDEDGTSETVVMLDDRNAGTTGQGFIVTQPINRITFYFRGLANPDETFGIGPWRIERFAQ
ncbi:MAG: fibronectin type III domain-containing protein, partial [Pseudomonadota bacterium]